MNKFIKIIIIFFILFTISYSATDLLVFNKGKLNSSFYLNGNPFFTNNINFKKDSIYFKIKYPYSISLNNYYDFSEEINNAANDFGDEIDELDNGYSQTSNTSKVDLNQNFALKSFGISKKFSNLIVGFFWDEEYSLKANGFFNKIHLYLKDSNENEQIYFNFDGKLNYNFNFKKQNYGMYFSLLQSNSSNFSINIKKVNYFLHFNARLEPSAYIKYNGVKYFFGNENDPSINFQNGETNKLSQHYEGEYDASGYDISFSYNNKINKYFTYGFNFNYTFNPSLKGYYKAIKHDMSALNIDSDNEIFDINKVDFSKITLTNKIIDKNTKNIDLYIPDIFSVYIKTGFSKNLFFKLSPKIFLGDYGFKTYIDKTYKNDGIEPIVGLYNELNIYYLNIITDINYCKRYYTDEDIFIPHIKLQLKIPVSEYFDINFILAQTVGNTAEINGHYYY